jgi:hypothetical protein
MPAGDRFVVVPAVELEAFLQAKGFERGRHRTEVVYRRRHHVDPRYVVCVYTSLTDGATVARDLGADAIRVVAYQELSPDGSTSRGVAKTPKILRTGSVAKILDRILDRARVAYTVCNQRVKEDRRRSTSVPPKSVAPPPAKHLCHAEGCRVEVSPKFCMCSRHWFLVPKILRDEVWASYVPGQETRKDPSQRSLRAIHEAVEAVARLEGRR